MSRIETKISTVFAGTIAVFGFALVSGSSALDLWIAIPYLIPLWVLMRALGVREYSIVPDAEVLGTSWPFYPKKTIAAVFGAMQVSVEELATNVGVKAKEFHNATLWLFWLTLVIVVIRTGEMTLRAMHVLPPTPWAQLSGLATPEPTAPPSANATPLPR